MVPIARWLAAAGVEPRSAELVQRPTTHTPIEDKRLDAPMRLIDVLEDHDDVQAVHAAVGPDLIVPEPLRLSG